MPNVSDLGKPVTDINGEPVGRLQDLIACVCCKMPHPQVVALQVKRGDGNLLVSFAADLAEIISDLSCVESSCLLEMPDVEIVADALEEVEPEFQASLIETMPDEWVADVLGGDGARHRRVHELNLRAGQDEVAWVVAKYNILVAPVVDDEGHLYGIVTADDALDKITPTTWKKRLPHMYR